LTQYFGEFHLQGRVSHFPHSFTSDLKLCETKTDRSIIIICCQKSTDPNGVGTFLVFRGGQDRKSRFNPRRPKNSRANEEFLADGVRARARARSCPASRTNEKVLKPKGFRTFSFFVPKKDEHEKRRFSNTFSNTLSGALRFPCRRALHFSPVSPIISPKKHREKEC